MKKYTLIFCLLIFVLNSFIVMEVQAGITGKIAGTIIDEETNEPLIGANLVLDGTSLGAATDEIGFYVILNIPPGSYRLIASMIGWLSVPISQPRSISA